MTRLRNLLFALVFYGGSVVAVLWALLVAQRPAAARRLAKRWTRFHYWCAHRLLGIETRVEGAIPAAPALFAAKHQAMFETFELVRLLHEPAVVLKQELVAIPLWGRVVATYGVIPVDRDGSAAALRTILHAARAAVADGRSILIFPEGTRVLPGEQPALRPGFAGVYRAVGLPVIPVALDSGRLWPRKGAKRAGVVTIRFGEPIPPGLPRREIDARVHAAINALEE